MRIHMKVVDGFLYWDHSWLESLEDESLRSWLDNVAPEDLVHGEFPIAFDTEIEWDEDGPRFTPATSDLSEAIDWLTEATSGLAGSRRRDMVLEAARAVAQGAS